MVHSAALALLPVISSTFYLIESVNIHLICAVLRCAVLIA